MAMTDWRIKGTEFGTCNCDWGCPCQFNARPSAGHCTGGLAMKIDEGYFGATRLDGIVWGMMGQWPGAIHEGNGALMVYIDESADAKQRQALVEIVHGKHSAEGTLFHIFSAVCPKKVDPVFAPIELTIDHAARTAKLRVPGVLEASGEPIRNPVTNDPHYPKLVLPNGFEFKEADFASGNLKATGPLKIDKQKGHAHFAQIQLGPQGFIE
jgi:hypothetical protein